MTTAIPFAMRCVAVASLAGAASLANADVVTDWNTTAGDLIVQAKLGTPPAVRAMAIVQTSVHEAVAAAETQQGRDPRAVAAAVAAANRTSLAKLLPQQEAAIAAAYQAALAKVDDGPQKAAGIAAGEQAAARVLAWRADDGAAPERYRPHAAPGAYVPTAGVAAAQWPERKPWLMTAPSQFRPAPPPSLRSARWARDYNEVKSVGSKTSRERTPEQTEVARFWEFSLPPIYHGVVRSVASAPGRSVAQNARLYAAASQAMDDGLIAVMDVKYHYNFWRPVTAIRNGDRDGNRATDIEPGWLSLIDNPMHPEYPSAHSILAGALGEVLKGEAAGGALPELATTSPTANGATRRWTTLDAFMQEVANSRVWAGIHYRTSIEVGLAMGKQIGALAVLQVAQSPVDPAVAAAGPAPADPQATSASWMRLATTGSPR